MKISQDTENIINYLLEFSENKLRKTNDLAVIIEISATYNGFEELDELIFISSSIKKLNSAILSNKYSSAIELTYKELENEILKFQEILFKYIPYLDENLTKRFNDTYLAHTQGAFKNIIDLAIDMAFLKAIQMSKKEMQKAQTQDKSDTL